MFVVVASPRYFLQFFSVALCHVSMFMLTCEQEDIEGLTKKERSAKISKNNHIRSGAVTDKRFEIFKKKVARRTRPRRSAKNISKLAGDVLELRREGERRFRYL